MKQSFFLVFFLFNSLVFSQKLIHVGVGKSEKSPFELKGAVFSAATGEKLPGASIFIERQNIGVSADIEGEYKLELYTGIYELRVSLIGYKTVTKRINLVGSGNVNFLLPENIVELDEVVFEFQDKNHNITNNKVGTEVLEISSIKSLPLIGGEVNVLNSLTLLPGVSSQGEASSGLNVRGGGSDQNLILLGGATLYNPFHLFGFFSGFNASVVRDVSLHKGVIPANYGGRSSSVIDISYRKGNFNRWEGDVNLGTTASKFSLRGPAVKSKLAIMTAGRIAYPNWLIGQAKDPQISNSTASFYDVNLVANYSLNEKNSLEYSYYLSGDSFKFPDAIENKWFNRAHVLKWSSEFNENFLFDISGVSNKYTSFFIEDAPSADFTLERFVNHNELNLDFNYLLNEKDDIKFGTQVKFLENNLGDLTSSSQSSVIPLSIDKENAIESGIYIQHNASFKEKTKISYGLRYTRFTSLGPGIINQYRDNKPRDRSSVIGKSFFDNEPIKTYEGVEPRIALTYQLNNSSSIKGGYSKVYQYIHLISNTVSISPTDTWKLSDPFIAPQVSSQYSLGFFKNLLNNRIEASIQAFYKESENLPLLKDGAEIFINPNLETEIVNGEGKAYGMEFLFTKSVGRLHGWLSYTYSRSFQKVISNFESELLNRGKSFPSNYDKPHNLSTVLNYRLGRNTTLTSVFSYSSGSPFTIPQGKFEFLGEELPYYNERNNIRAPAIHRLDVSIKFNLNTKKKLWSGQWTFSIYNIYGRKNPFSVFFKDFPGKQPQAYKLSIIGSPFPSLSYEIKF